MELIEYLNREGINYSTDSKGLTVGGSLYLSDTGITSLPDGLTVGGYLDLSGTGITSLPDGLTVGGALIIDPVNDLTSVSAYRHNCGDYERTIYAVRIGAEIKCHAGCFSGTLDEFCSAVDNKYSDEEAEIYKQQMRDCVNDVIRKTGANK